MERTGPQCLLHGLAIEYARRFGGAYDLVGWIAADDLALIPDQLAQIPTLSLRFYWVGRTMC